MGVCSLWVQGIPCGPSLITTITTSRLPLTSSANRLPVARNGRLRSASPWMMSSGTLILVRSGRQSVNHVGGQAASAPPRGSTGGSGTSANGYGPGAIAIRPDSAPAAPIDLPGLRTGCDFALLSGEGGQHLPLLTLGHLEVIKGVGKFRSDFVEHGG